MNMRLGISIKKMAEPKRLLNARSSDVGAQMRNVLILLMVAGAGWRVAGQAAGQPLAGGEPPRRIIDVDAARKAKQSYGKGFFSHLSFPLKAVGSRMERGLVRVETENLLQRFADWQAQLAAKGIEPGVGGMGEGAGFALGTRLTRKNLWGRGAIAGLTVRESFKFYQFYGMDLEVPLHARGLFFRAETNYRVRPQEDFYGLGIDAPKSARTNYNLQDRTVAVGLGARFTKRIEGLLSFGYTSARVFGGSNPRYQSFGAAQESVPGAHGGRYVFYRAAVAMDGRDSTWDPKRGALLRLAAGSYDSVNGQDFGWFNYRFEAQAFRPLGDTDHVLAFRLLGDFNDEKGGSQVPFFVLGRLGGRYSMRGYAVNRFTDLNGMVATVEYRYAIWPKYMDAIAFFDAGQVAHRTGEFGWSRARTDWGIGFKAKTLRSALLRFDVGFGPEGPRYRFTFSPEF
jgi:outer membrane protein assembly factor BamA